MRGVLNALCTSQARGKTGSSLVELFARIGPHLKVRDSVAIALAHVADEDVFLQIERLVSDEGYGSDRLALVDALGSSGGKRALPTLRILANSDLRNRVPKPLGLYGEIEDIPILENFLESDQAWVRNEAKRAIRRIEERTV